MEKKYDDERLPIEYQRRNQLEEVDPDPLIEIDINRKPFSNNCTSQTLQRIELTSQDREGQSTIENSNELVVHPKQTTERPFGYSH